MGVFGAVFGRRGDAGFSGALLWVCSGVVGFNVAMFLRPVRDTFRPARPDVGASAKKFAPQAQNGQNMLFSGALGEFFRGNAAEGIPPGEFFRGPAVVGSHRGSFFADQQSWDPAGRVCCAVCLAAGPRPPPIGLACELKGSRARDAFIETEVGLGGSQASRCLTCL